VHCSSYFRAYRSRHRRHSLLLEPSFHWGYVGIEREFRLILLGLPCAPSRIMREGFNEIPGNKYSSRV